MIRYEKDLDIRSLIDLASNEKIMLPEFQRAFVWDRTQIKLLIDSLYSGYTINSILFWNGEDELARRKVGGSIRDIIIPSGTSEKVTYILDGQQRITALMLVFTDKTVYRGSNVKKKEKLTLYFDSEYKGDDPEQRFIYDDEIISIDGEDVVLNRLTEEEIFSKYKTRFVKLKDVYSKDKRQLMNLINDNDLYLEYDEKLDELEERILRRKVIDIEQPGSLEDVLEVFERINTRNTKLNIFDIMVAKTYRKLGDDYFDLRTYIKLINYRDSIRNDYIWNKENLDYENIRSIVDEATLLFLIMIILKKKFKQKEILKITTEDLLSNLKRIHRVYQKTLELLKYYGVEEKEISSYQPILKFITAFVSENETLTIEKEKKEFLDKWFWNTLIYNRYPGAQNERIEKDFNIIKKYPDLMQCLELMLKDKTRDFSKIEVSSLANPEYFDAYYTSKNQQIYKALWLVLKSSSPKDFLSGIEPSSISSSFNKLEEHHIFPSKSNIGKEIIKISEATKYPDIIDNIANIAFITKETNHKIQNKDPGEYIVELENEYKRLGKIEEFRQIMLSQFITEDMVEDMKMNDFYSFIYKRTKLILERIKKLCNVPA